MGPADGPSGEDPGGRGGQGDVTADGEKQHGAGDGGGGSDQAVERAHWRVSSDGG